jgi:hypothetical protein
MQVSSLIQVLRISETILQLKLKQFLKRIILRKEIMEVQALVCLISLSSKRTIMVKFKEDQLLQMQPWVVVDIREDIN